MSTEWERQRDSGSTAHDRWKTDPGPDDDPESDSRVDAMNYAWHQRHREHEPLCHLCREIQRLRAAYSVDTQAEYVRRTEAAD